MKRRLQSRFFVHALALPLIALAAAGCDKGFGSVSGKVTVEGKPLKSGVVNLEWPTGQVAKNGQALLDHATSAVIDGSYSIPRVPAGIKANVGVMAAFEPPARKMSGEVAVITKEEKKKISEQKGNAQIPQKYNSPATSGLTLDVKRGSNQFDINLQP